jgi:co-chaperonin GroES (HSP10)
MAIKPLGHRLLVKPEKLEEVDEVRKRAIAAGLILETKDREQAAVDQGIVIDIGSTAWKAFDDGEPWASIGDRVVYSRYGGKVIKDPDTQEDFVILNDEDVIAKL